jgi:hypothetical protein
MALSTSTNGSFSSQINTQSPQTSAAAGAGSPPAAPARNVQPGTTNSLLSGAGGGSEGIPLNSTILPVANLSTAAQTTVAQDPRATTTQQQPNTVLLVIVAVLAIMAVIAIWRTPRSAKNTTQS